MVNLSTIFLFVRFLYILPDAENEWVINIRSYRYTETYYCRYFESIDGYACDNSKMFATDISEAKVFRNYLEAYAENAKIAESLFSRGWSPNTYIKKRKYVLKDNVDGYYFQKDSFRDIYQ